ncbi:MAG: hypothetical protein M1829_004697 [Trizodia sp. TS-e1964]|nr:MAG: hypothetical protein M1829_004697 [Trizodia sp. TS-e1964]
MSSTAGLQLFPPPSNRQPRTQRKIARGNSVKSNVQQTPSSTHSKSPALHKEMVIHVTPDAIIASPLESPAMAHLGDHSRSYTPSNSNAPSSRLGARSPAPSTAPSFHRGASSPAPSNVPSSRPGATSPASMMRSYQPSEGTTLVRSNSTASSTAAPIQSMFPQYNPELPLSQQQYYPSLASPSYFPRQAFSNKAEYPPSMSPPSPSGKFDIGLHSRPGQLTAPPTTTTFQSEAPDILVPFFSSRKDLAELWEAANGQTVRDGGRIFALKVTRDGAIDPSTGSFSPTISESFSFGASKEAPFYTLKTIAETSFNPTYRECAINRHDPRKGNPVSIMFFSLESPERRLPPGDGLITEIYPKVAAMMALDQINELSMAKGAGETDQENEAQRAVRKAAEKECCRLIWNSEIQKYQLLHPGLNGGKGQRFTAHIEGQAGFDLPGGRGIVKLVNEKDQSTLASLEFGTSTLLIDTSATALVDSFYIVDVAVAAIFTIALVEGRRLRFQRYSAPAGLSAAVVSPSLRRSNMQEMEFEEAGDIPKHKSSRGVLSLLFDSFRFVVWALSLVVNALAALLSGLSSCMSRKK